ncbi:MAG TPA: metallophosphoesterase [Thermoanaerobaculia bacterium]|nr:metallophosphoesterase [Thermoanaerobaculia bacterium]
MRLFFASDLHGAVGRYDKLFAAAARERPTAVFLGGDLLPGGALLGAGDFFAAVLAPRLERLRQASPATRVLAILGNDDPRSEEASLLALAGRGLLDYAHARRLDLGGHAVYGYACVPPTPFLLKDWERYDVSRYVDPGCVSPEEGVRTVAVPEGDVRWGTIAADLDRLAGGDDLSAAVFLFHSPPYRTRLDRAALAGRSVDHAPLDEHVGSIAIRRFLEARQPLLALHGHIHESARLTGSWRDAIGRTHLFSAAHDGPELALVRVDLEAPEAATRELV